MNKEDTTKITPEPGMDEIRAALEGRQRTEEFPMTSLHRWVSGALDESRAARDEAGRSEQGRRLAVISTELEKLLALVEFYGLGEIIEAAVEELADADG